MDRIEINVITGEQRTVPLTAEEVAQAQANYAEWLAAQAEAVIETPAETPVEPETPAEPTQEA